MSMDDGEHFVRYREHVATRDELRQKLQELELQSVRLSASLVHLPERVDALVTSVNNLSQQVAAVAVQKAPPQPSPEVDHAALALHRALDKAGGGSMSALKDLMLLALTSVCSFFVARFFIGG